MACRLWYLERDGSKAAGTVVSVDSSIQPPSYAVCIDKSDGIRYPSSPTPASLRDIDTSNIKPCCLNLLHIRVQYTLVVKRRGVSLYHIMGV